MVIQLESGERREACEKPCLGFPKVWQNHILDRRNPVARWTIFKNTEETDKLGGLWSHHPNYTDQLASFRCEQFLWKS